MDRMGIVMDGLNKAKEMQSEYACKMRVADGDDWETMQIAKNYWDGVVTGIEFVLQTNGVRVTK